MAEPASPDTSMLRETRAAADRGPGPIVPTEYWSTLDDGRVQCEMCPRLCKLREGARGLCFVRAPPERPHCPDHLTAAPPASASTRSKRSR